MITFNSIEDFYKESETGIEFKLYGKNYLIEFDDPFTGGGRVRIHLEDADGNGYFDKTKVCEYSNLEELVHSYKIDNRSLAEVICDENKIPRSVLPIKYFKLDFTKEMSDPDLSDFNYSETLSKAMKSLGKKNDKK